MAISDQIERLQDIKDTLRTALVGLGLVTSEAMLDACAEAVAGIPNRGRGAGQHLGCGRALYRARGVPQRRGARSASRRPRNPS